MSNSSVLRNQVRQFVDNATDEELKILYRFFELNQEGDWWDAISEKQQQAISESLKEADSGKNDPT